MSNTSETQAAPAPADVEAQAKAAARQAWHQAAKLRRLLHKQIEQVKNDSDSGTDVAQFDAIDDTLIKLRLACVHTIFLDFEYAVAETTEDILWTFHISINDQYRRILQKLRHNSRVVEKRKVEGKYNYFLRVAQSFYKTYIQRLSVRYDIADLKRIAERIEAEKGDATDMISPVPAVLRNQVRSSCHATLIRLGDLARYRVQARHKKTYDMALTYYSLANDLIPTSGFGFHQMGIINIDEGHSLDVIYFFYRSWAVQEPHPRARENVEIKFNTIQKQSRAPQGRNSRGKTASPTPLETFMLWFSRLHALFYKGEPASAQLHELEREVIHRLSLAVKDREAAPVILKMILVNFSAYWAASKKYNDDRTLSAYNFRQHTLNFIARFFHKLCEVIELDFKEFYENEGMENEGSGETVHIPLTTALLLPILRIHCMWSAGRRADIFCATGGPADVVPSLVKSLGRVLTYLCAEMNKLETDVQTCPYLLPEDLEIRGFLPFSDEEIPSRCRNFNAEDGKLKPHRTISTQPLDTIGETIARMLDILRSGLFLAEDPVVPLTYSTATGPIVFHYQVNDPVEGAQDIVQPAVNQTHAGASDEILEEVNGATSYQTSDHGTGDPSLEANSPHQQPPAMRVNDHNVPSTEVQPSGLVSGLNATPQQEAPQSPPRDMEHLKEMDPASHIVVDMLTPFLEPAQGASSSTAGNSRKRSTAEAQDLAQELLMSFKPGQDMSAPYYESMSPAHVGSSTWANYFAPSSPAARGSGPTSPGSNLLGRHSSSHSPRGSLNARDASQDLFATPNRREPFDAHTLPTNQRGSHASTPGQLRNDQSYLTASSSSGHASTGWPQYGPHYGQQSNTWSAPAPVGAPASSSMSGFSNLSSIYAGTPYNGMTYGQPAYGSFGNRQTHEGQRQDESNTSPSGRDLRMQQTTSTYDAQIFQNAMRGN